MKKMSSIKNIKGSQKQTLQSILTNKPAWGQYSASNWVSGTNTLTDLTGNGRHATTSGVAYGTTTGNGCSGSITSIGGTTTTTILFPTGSIPTTFTVASLSRYSNTGAVNRVFQNISTGNWFHGHQGSKRGVSYYEGWKTAQASLGTQRNWLNCVGTNGSGVSIPSNILVDGSGVGVANVGTGNMTMAINLGRTAETSDFEFSQLIIWDVALTTAEMVVVSNSITNYMNTGFLQ